MLDSMVRIEELPKKAKELGMEAVASTNHGYISSLIDFYKSCKKEDIKPILGVELYVCDDIQNRDTDNRYDHLIVLAKNNIGYKNLLKLSSLGFTEGFYYKPRVDMKTIEKYKEGLIVMTACLGGEIPKLILKDKDCLIDLKLIEYKRIFGDNLYLEVQSANNSQQEKVNKTLSILSGQHDIPLVVTSDIHFLNKEDYKAHGVFISINQDRDNEFYQDCWFKTENEVLDVLIPQIGIDCALEAVTNTHKIADRCNVEIELGKSYLPDFPVPKEFKSEDEFLWHLIEKGFIERCKDKLSDDEQQIYWDRLRYEYDVITKTGFSGYFLIVRDIIRLCKEHGILTGDGRGSADNSEICYIIGITNVDSIKYDLNFSRFMTLERKSLPDIDMDIQSSRKQELVNLLKDRYGHDKVAQICTFQTLQAKSCLDAVGKALGMTYAVTTEIKKYIPEQTSLKDALETNSKLKACSEKFIDSKGIEHDTTELFDLTMKLEGLTRGISVHAGGVVICPSNMDMEDFTALALSSKKEEITQFEMSNIEEVGLVKLDCLGVIVLDIIQDTVNIKSCMADLDVEKLDFDNDNTWKLLCEGNTAGIFQLESSGMTEACIRIQPHNMSDLIALISLYRPDTMSQLEHYIRRKHGQEEVVYIHPDMKPILSETYGCIIYQEQIMQIAKIFAGFSDGEADSFRKGIGKKNKELVREQAEKFRVRCIEKGYPEEVANMIADTLSDMGGYSFNKGHGSGYGISSYKTAYLKANYPIEFMCSLMTNQKKSNGQTDYENVGLYIIKCQEMGIEVRNPNINISERIFTPDGNNILFGLDLIKGLSKNAIEMIIKHRPFKGLEDFINKTASEVTINKTSIISLIKSGCFDFNGLSRKELLRKYAELRYGQDTDKYKPLKSVSSKHIQKLLDAKIIKSYETNDKDNCLNIMNKWRKALYFKEWEEEIMSGNEFDWEFQTLSYHLKGDPFKNYRLPKWETYHEDFEEAKFFGTVVAVKKTKIKKGNQKGRTMAFIEFSTPDGIREGVCFANSWGRLQDRLEKGSMVVVKGKKQGEKCLISGAVPFEIWKEKYRGVS